MNTEAKVNDILGRMRDVFEEFGAKNIGCVVYVCDTSFDGAGAGFHKNCEISEVINMLSTGYGINLTSLANNQTQYNNVCVTRADIKEHCTHNTDDLL